MKNTIVKIFLKNIICNFYFNFSENEDLSHQLLQQEMSKLTETSSNQNLITDKIIEEKSNKMIKD
jgi:hypothetical protein